MSLREKVRPERRAAAVPTAPNDRRRLHGSIAHDLAVAIVGGRYRPGDVLPNEDLFSQQLSVSRTAYREAVRILAAKGLVESRPKTGTRICDRTRWNIIDPDVLAWHLEAAPSDGLIDALFELRRIVEPAAAGMAAERRTDDDLAAMLTALTLMERDGLSSERALQADLEFHHAILVATGNEPLTALSSGIGTTIRWTTTFKQRTGTLPRDPLAEHRQVFEAIQARDAAGARATMTALIDQALAATRDAFTKSRA
ncbi:FadR/GntR family transcriptional regulator [Prosthecomicrobium sp. N25]|uniref:FadR/GntR family transcriptional regulator n=1 Tax=Prosthecomicrobium sp. N25 TaxID=3129254 RepID=UPI003077A754